jgi:hypothetical protein
MQQRLLDSNMQQIDPPLAEVLELLITLDGAWSGVAAQLRPNKEASGRAAESPLEGDTSRWSPAGQGSKYTARHTVSA